MADNKKLKCPIKTLNCYYIAITPTVIVIHNLRRVHRRAIRAHTFYLNVRLENYWLEMRKF